MNVEPWSQHGAFVPAAWSLRPHEHGDFYQKSPCLDLENFSIFIMGTFAYQRGAFVPA